MILGNKGSVLVSSLGWVDHGALWIFDVAQGKPHALDLSTDARYLSLHSQNGDFFCVAHHSGGNHLDLTVHRFSEPEKVLARARAGIGAASSGDSSVWEHVPGLYVEYLKEPWKDFVLVSLAPDGTSSIQPLRWYDDSYDKGYQGVIGVLKISDTTALLSVQRSSTLIFHDLKTSEQSGSLQLANRGGNPDLHLRPERDEIWTVDYDTVVVVDTRTWTVKASRHLQEDSKGVRQFLGNLAFSEDGETCVVARPFSGDILELDPATLKVLGSAASGGHPLDVAVVGSNEVIARDWKTGKLLRGVIKRKGWAS